MFGFGKPKPRYRVPREKEKVAERERDTYSKWLTGERCWACGAEDNLFHDKSYTSYTYVAKDYSTHFRARCYNCQTITKWRTSLYGAGIERC